MKQHASINENGKIEALQRSIETVEGYLESADRIIHKDLKDIIPFTAENFEHITWQQKKDCEVLIFHFTRTQDTLASKTFSLFLDGIEEPTEGLSFVDKLNLLEKLGVIEKAYEWRDFRKLRNHFSHDYVDEPKEQAHYMNQVVQSIPIFIACLNQIKKRLPKQ